MFILEYLGLHRGICGNLERDTERDIRICIYIYIWVDRMLESWVPLLPRLYYPP